VQSLHVGAVTRKVVDGRNLILHGEIRFVCLSLLVKEISVRSVHERSGSLETFKLIKNCLVRPPWTCATEKL
jgi:hypothetical protein